MIKTKKGQIKGIISSAVALVFLIYFFTLIASELDFGPLLNPSIFGILIAGLVIVFLISVGKRLF